MSETRNKKGLMMIVGLGVVLIVLMMVFSAGKPAPQASPGEADKTNVGTGSEKDMNLSAQELVTENEKLQAEIQSVQQELEKLKAVDSVGAVASDSQKESEAR